MGNRTFDFSHQLVNRRRTKVESNYSRDRAIIAFDAFFERSLGFLSYGVKVKFLKFLVVYNESKNG